MNKIEIYYNDRKIILQEINDEENSLYENIDFSEDEDEDEPFLHKCNTRLGNILNIFFDNDMPTEISFEHEILDKLFSDFKSQFKYIEAAGGLVFNKKEELLIIERLGMIDLPKGKIDKGETPQIAALREIEEECGISDMKIIEELKPSFHIYEYKGKRILKKTFWYKMSYDGEQVLVPQAEENITGVGWYGEESFSELKEKTYASLKYHFENLINPKKI